MDERSDQTAEEEASARVGGQGRAIVGFVPICMAVRTGARKSSSLPCACRPDLSGAA